VPQASNPQSLNRYSYVLNNPQNYVDPSGYFFKKLFKSIGKFFKTLFKNPGMFFASLAVGLLTGGAAFAATGSWVIAGMVGGMFGGMTSAAMTGGNIWQAGLIGAIAGGVGGAVGAGYGGLAGAVAGGATAGAVGTAFNRGNFAVNVFAGGITSAIVYGVSKAIGAGLSSSENQNVASDDSGMIRYASGNDKVIPETTCDACQYVTATQRLEGQVSDLIHWMEAILGPFKKAGAVTGTAAGGAALIYTGGYLVAAALTVPNPIAAGIVMLAGGKMIIGGILLTRYSFVVAEQVFGPAVANHIDSRLHNPPRH
jgi:hypothetical protein